MTTGPAPLVVSPEPAPRDFGYGSAEAAIVAAGGVPGGAGPRPLLVVVNDPERATRTAEALAAMRALAPGRRFDVHVATGSHEFAVPVRMPHAEMLRAAAGEPVRIGWHEGRDPASSRPLRGCGRSVSRYVQAALASSDLAVIGSVESHWFAGVTGAHKALTVGIMPVAEITRNHRNAMSGDARPFRLEGNPIFDDLRPIAAEVCAGRTVLAVQHVGDRWLAGDPLATLPALAEAARHRWLRRVPHLLDWVVCHVESPLSRSLYQAEKAVKHSEFAVRDGGVLAIVAECEEGIGPRRFAEMMSAAADSASMRAAIDRDGYRLGDHKAVRLRALLDRGVRLFIVSETLDPEVVRVTGFGVVRRIEDLPRSGTGAIVHDAAHCVLEVGA